MSFESEVFVEYKKLREKLQEDKELLVEIDKRNMLNNQLRNLDVYSTEYNLKKNEYDEISNKLQSNVEYREFKVLEREINLFIMYCNKELEKLFDLEGRVCSHENSIG